MKIQIIKRDLLHGNYLKWLVVSFFIVLIIISPLIPVIQGFLLPSSAAWENILENLLDDYLINTSTLLVLTLSISLIIGIGSAWYISIYEFPGYKFLSWGLILPLSIPSYIAAYIYSDIFSYTGPISLFYEFLSGEKLFIDIMNIYWLAFLLALVLYPYIYIAAKTSFEALSTSYIEPAMSLKMNNRSIFYKIIMPLARPAIIGGASLVIMELLNDYGAAKYFGINTFTVGIFRAWFSYGDLNAAIKLASVLFLFVLLIILIERAIRGKAKFEDRAKKRTFNKIKLSGIKGMSVTIGIWSLFAIAFIIPLAKMISNFYSSMRSDYSFEIWNTFSNTIMLSLISTFFLILFGILIAYNTRINKNKFSLFINRVASTGYSIPGAIIAIGVIYLLSNINNTFFDGKILLAGTIFALVFANTVRFLAVSLNNVDSGFSSINRHVDESAYSIGLSPLKNFFTNIFPLSGKFILAAIIITFIDVSKELPLTLILRPFNFETLATNSYRFASDEMLVYSSVPSLVLVILSSIAVYVLNKYFISKR